MISGNSHNDFFSSRVLESVFAPLQQAPETILQFGQGTLHKRLSAFGIEFPGGKEALNGKVVVVITANQASRQLPATKNGAVNRVLYARHEWKEILAVAANPDLKIIILSQKLVRKNILKDTVPSDPPFSAPGKLLAVLFHRFKKFDGDATKGVVVVSADEDASSPEIVESIILELAHLNNLDPAFLDWVENANQFYSRYI